MPGSAAISGMPGLGRSFLFLGWDVGLTHVRNDLHERGENATRLSGTVEAGLRAEF